jgi:hypothetical protein
VANATYNTQTLIWQSWNQATSPGSVSAYYWSPTWDQWVANATSTSAVTTTWYGWNQNYQETREQAEQRKEQMRQQVERNRERQRALDAEREAYRAARQAASARAEELLLSLLTDEQAACYTENGYFEVRGSSGGRWRIRNRGQMGNVDLMPEIGDVRLSSYCCHPPDNLPDADAHAAQMLHLVTDEDGFKRTANVTYMGAAA